MPKLILGRDSEGPYELTDFSDMPVLPFDIGSFERDQLSYLGDWTRVKKKEEPFGIWYRMGMKDRVIDAEGDSATLFLHFVAPFVREGYVMTPEAKFVLNERIEKMVTVSTVLFSQALGNVIGVRLQPPAYMLEELVALAGR